MNQSIEMKYKKIFILCIFVTETHAKPNLMCVGMDDSLTKSWALYSRPVDGDDDDENLEQQSQAKSFCRWIETLESLMRL